MRVVLPEPLGPTRAVTVASSRVRDTSRSADASPLFDESLVDEDREGLADGGRVDAVGRGVLRGGGELVPSAQGAAQDLRADVVGDLHVDRDPRDERGCHAKPSLQVLWFITCLMNHRTN